MYYVKDSSTIEIVKQVTKFTLKEWAGLLPCASLIEYTHMNALQLRPGHRILRLNQPFTVAQLEHMCYNLQ